MKLLTFIIILIFSITTILHAQIPNADFENWSNQQPLGWWTSDTLFTVYNVMQSNDAESGSSSVKGIVINSNNEIIPPILGSGAVGNPGFIVNQRYTNLNGYYKFNSINGDLFGIRVTMFEVDSHHNYVIIGGGASNIASSANTYTPFTVHINYISSDIPDTCIIDFLISGIHGLHVGSYFFIDNLSLNSVTTVNNKMSNPANFTLYQNYPNPFNPSTAIEYNLKENSDVILTVFNSLGKRIKELSLGNLVPGKHLIKINMAQQSSGIYLYRIEAISNNDRVFEATKKMILLK